MKQEFSTFDLGLATVLVTLGYELLELDKQNPKKVRFVFKRKKNIEQEIDNYWSNNTKLPPQILFNNQKMLKNRIYSDA